MDQQYVYDDGAEDEGLTFKKIGAFIKKAWLRVIVYAVVAALLTTAIALPIKVFYKSEPIARTSIEYIYSGIERGVAPDGSTLDTSNIISPAVLADAVTQANLTDKISDISSLRNVMRVESVKTDEYVALADAAANGDATAAERLRNYNMFPTRFDIVISEPKSLGLSDDQATLLLNKVVTSYYADFQKRYTVTSMFADNAYALSQNNSLEFTDIYDIYTQSLNSVADVLRDFAEKDAGFISVSNNTTFTQLLSDFQALDRHFSRFNADILSKNVWRNPIAAKNALIESRADITNKLKPLEDYIVELSKQISAYEPNTTTTDNGGTHTITIQYPADYFIYQARLDESNRQVRDYNVQLKNIETRLTRLENVTETDQAAITAASDTLQALEAQTAAFVKKTNATIADYYDTTFISSSVRQTQPPVVTRKGSGFSLLVVYLVAVIVAVLAACVVTGVKKGNAADKKKAHKASGDASPVEPDTTKEE